MAANSYDSTYCSVLGQMAVHGAMAGYSGITVPSGPVLALRSGQVGQIYSRRSAFLHRGPSLRLLLPADPPDHQPEGQARGPLEWLVKGCARGVNPKGRWFFRMTEATKQPNFRPDVAASLPVPSGSADVLEAGAKGPWRAFFMGSQGTWQGE